MMKAFLAALLALFTLMLAPAGATGKKVALELVLAVDASSSVDPQEFQLQVSGHVTAFKDPDVIAAISAQGQGGVAVTYVEWSSRFEQIQVVGWTQVHDQATAYAFANAIKRNANQARASGTAIGEAVIYSVQLIENNEYNGARRVVDVSADDRYNAGSTPSYAQDVARRGGVQVNGLAVDPTGVLTSYFRKNVIAGPGAFVMQANSYADFARAIKLKLLRELSTHAPISLLRHEGN
ncbi:MAG: DUF1194 domain-containing protein [Rhizobiales bacterium]|nr:DUF1194 domain-containing protein [Hyphomicrobiales bacterium]